jgi:predicted RNA-binding protein YlqC (UPF0109 family)
MPDHEEVRDWLLNTVQLVVDLPDEVLIEAVSGDQRTTFRIRANPAHVGKVIGRQGRTSQSLRVLAGAMGKKFNWRFVVEIEEVNKLL